jgi:hypothetical protein
MAQYHRRGPHADRPCLDAAQGSRLRCRRYRDRGPHGLSPGRAGPRAVGCRRAAFGGGCPAGGRQDRRDAFRHAWPCGRRDLPRCRHRRCRQHGPGRRSRPDRLARPAPAGFRPCPLARRRPSPGGHGPAQRREPARLGTADRGGERTHGVERAFRAARDEWSRLAGRDRRACGDIAAGSVAGGPGRAELPPAGGGGVLPPARGSGASEALHAAAADQGADVVRAGAGARSRLCHGPRRPRFDLSSDGVNRDAAAVAGR